jgi:hypothetical protein
MKKKNMNLEQMYDERDDLKCAVTLLKMASACISEECESAKSEIRRLIAALEEEESLCQSRIDSWIEKLRLERRRFGEVKE